MQVGESGLIGVLNRSALEQGLVLEPWHVAC